MFQLSVPSWFDLSLLLSVLLLIGVFAYRGALLKPFIKATNVSRHVANTKAEKQAGESPASFQYPEIRPFPSDPLKAKPVPYRPFKWGDYHVNMGLITLKWDEWLEVDCEFERFFKIKEARIAQRGDRLIQTLPARPGVGSGSPAAIELLHEVAEFLSRRYPTLYSVTRHPAEKKSTYGWYGQGDIKEITIIPLNRTFPLDEGDPLVTVAKLTQEDFAIMIKGDDGGYYFQAGAVCVAGTWRLTDKIGMHLDEIHTSGDVPQYKSKLESPMNRFMRRMTLDKPVTRNNYAFQVIRDPSDANQLDPTELGWEITMKGHEDLFQSEGIYWLYDSETGSSTQQAQPESPKIVTPSMVWQRSERETLRRLPKTGAIVFTIRVYQTPITEMVKELGIPGRMANGIRSWPADVAQYKAKSAYEGILSYLDEWHAKQVEEGVEIKVDNTYPF